LTMDYEVFLMSRIREEHVHGLKTREAVDHGIAAIGRVIVAAALIMCTDGFMRVLGSTSPNLEEGRHEPVTHIRVDVRDVRCGKSPGQPDHCAPL
ncbi:MAG: MMPL family transporter, partial [Actinomycetes bacterium]